VEIELPYQWRPRPYQEPLWWSLEAGCKRAVCIWHRRSGKDMTALNWCATQSFNRVGLYWHLFPTYSEGRKVIWQGRDKAERLFLDAFPEDLYYRKLEQEMSIFLKNGSIYQVVGSDHVDRLMGANPIGVIVSEYALQNPAAWDLIRPMLAENEGWAIFPYCVSGDTLVQTNDGLLRMDEIADGRDVGFTPCGHMVTGIGGPHAATDFYRAGRQKTLRIRTSKGYEVECTPSHKLWTGSKWKRASEWKEGECVTIATKNGQFGNETGWRGWTPKPRGRRGGQPKPLPFERADTDFYYFLGLTLAEGYWTDYNITITNTDAESQRVPRQVRLHSARRCACGVFERKSMLPGLVVWYR